MLGTLFMSSCFINFQSLVQSSKVGMQIKIDRSQPANPLRAPLRAPLCTRILINGFLMLVMLREGPRCTVIKVGAFKVLPCVLRIGLHGFIFSLICGFMCNGER